MSQHHLQKKVLLFLRRIDLAVADDRLPHAVFLLIGRKLHGGRVIRMAVAQRIGHGPRQKIGHNTML